MPTSTPERGTPTVIVARRVVPGREAEFETWVASLLRVAAQAPGFVSQELERPNELHPDEWVVMYQFHDPASLQAWLESAERAELIAQGEALVRGAPREQLIALPTKTAAVTAVSSVRVDGHHLPAYRALHDEVLVALRSFEGFIATELFEPVPGVQDDTVVTITFADRDGLDRWLASGVRASILERMEPLVVGERTINVVGGFAGWFEQGGGDLVPRWKQAALVLLALFPLSVALAWLRLTFYPGIALIPGIFVGNVLGVAALTWLIMPRLTRAFDRWLRGSRDSTS